MNFTFDCVKDKSRLQKNFYFDSEMPRGHFFAILDFAAHDYANLSASLKGKLETIISSFVSVSSFSADLFLRFLAKEINNFAHNLAQQSGGPALTCSAALCLISANRLSYFISGDTKIKILNSGRLLPLDGEKPAEVEQENKVATQLGATHLETPIKGQVQTFTLQDDDVVLIMTRGLAETIENQPLAAELTNLRKIDTKLICESIMKAGDGDDALVVISGPYEREPDPAFTELSKSVALLEAKLNALTEIQLKSSEAGLPARSVEAQFEQKFGQQITELQGELTKKAATVDLLELNEKVKNLSGLLAAKADTKEVIALRRDVVKVGVVSNSGALTDPNETVAGTAGPVPAEIAGPFASDDTTIPALAPRPAATSLTLRAALIVLLISLVAGFIGGWLASRRIGKSPEVWSVRTSGNQISISRQDGTNGGVVTLTAAQSLKPTGEQNFSSFADVKRYIDTITSADAPLAQASQNPQPTLSDERQASDATTEITVKPGDSLKKLAQQYNVPPEKLMELNPTIVRWPLIRIGQKIVVPLPGPVPASSSPSVQAGQSPASQSSGNTTELILAPGDSLNELARRFNTTVERLKELNPQISNWARIQPGQKVLVPSPAGRL